MRIVAIYPDKSKYAMTMDELKDYMKDEPKDWQTLFFNSLYDRGVAFGPIARYHLN
jgi:hypothetical protein